MAEGGGLVGVGNSHRTRSDFEGFGGHSTHPVSGRVFQIGSVLVPREGVEPTRGVNPTGF
jgi:hypothetical protein